MSAIDDAVDQLRRHRGLLRVGDPIEVDDNILIEVDIPIELPSRDRAKGISATGVHEIETCWLQFSSGWPLRAPRPYLRADFPLNLPHINPHQESQLVSPCVFEGSLDELLHRFGLDAIIDQVIDWLAKAAGGTLIDLEQGWEPVRRDTCPSTIVFSAERVCASSPPDGTVLSVGAGYIAIKDGIYAFLASDLHPQHELVFTQFLQGDPPRQFASGRCAAFIAQAPILDGQPLIVATYQPETVNNLKSLLEYARQLGIDREALTRALNDYYRRCIFQLQQEAISWRLGLYAIVILVVQRPVPLIGANGRSIEVLPYVVRYDIDPKAPLNHRSSVHPAFHAHAVSPELLARTSGISVEVITKKVVLLGCGSVGSKIGLHLGRAGFGAMTFVDNDDISPHNQARYALVDDMSITFPRNKAEQMKAAFAKLSHIDARAINADAVTVLTEKEQFADVVSEDTTLVVDATASLQLLAAESNAAPLSSMAGRLARVALYGAGRCAVLMLEGPARAVRVDDLNSLLFECCRTDEQMRSAMAGDSIEPARIFVGDNCRSLTTPMSDVVVSRGASLAAMQIERWLASGIPTSAKLCIGVADFSDIGMKWQTIAVSAVTALSVEQYGGWDIRILPGVVDAIDADSRHWGEVETGGALIGHISYECRTITIAGLVEAPNDSVRERTRFILGTDGLVPNLRRAHADSLGHLAFVGTWHSHPLGGQHSGIDRDTLRRIAEDAGGLPAVSVIWTPTGLQCEVDRW